MGKWYVHVRNVRRGWQGREVLKFGLVTCQGQTLTNGAAEVADLAALSTLKRGTNRLWIMN